MGKKRSHASPSDAAYKSEGRTLKNKVKKIAAHKLKHPNDIQSTGTVPNYNKNKL